jgi:hypothetical protein
MLVSTLDPVWTDASDGLKKNITLLMRGIDAVRDVLTRHKLHYALLGDRRDRRRRADRCRT